MRKSIAIIIARGGSKRIPRKNIKEFCGKPIISYSIQKALESGVFDEVMVSTDDMEIAEVAKAYGAIVPFMRSEQNASDFATTTDVIQEVLRMYSDIQSKKFKYFCSIYPTAPLLNFRHLQMAEKIVKSGAADAVVAVSRFSFPPQRAFIEKEGMVNYKWEEHRYTRSQDLEIMYQDAGQFNFGNTIAFEQEKTLIMKRTAPIILSELEVQDIDNETDWKLAELKYELLQNSIEG